MRERERMRGQGKKGRTEDRFPVSHGGGDDGDVTATHTEAMETGDWTLHRCWCVTRLHTAFINFMFNICSWWKCSWRKGEENRTKRIHATYPLRYAVNKFSNLSACLQFHTKSGCNFASCLAAFAEVSTRVSNTAANDFWQVFYPLENPAEIWMRYMSNVAVRHHSIPIFVSVVDSKCLLSILTYCNNRIDWNDYSQRLAVWNCCQIDKQNSKSRRILAFLKAWWSCLWQLILVLSLRLSGKHFVSLFTSFLPK